MGSCLFTFFGPLPLVLYLGLTPRDEQVSNNARLLKRYKMDESRVSTLTCVITHLKRKYSHMQSTSLLKWRKFKQKLIWFKYIQATSKSLSICEVVEEVSPIFSLKVSRNRQILQREDLSCGVVAATRV